MAGNPLRDLTRMRPRFEALLGSADVTPFVAESGGAAAGIAILHFRRRLNFTTFEGWISELFVRPAARGQGIGRALLEALVAEWRLRGGHRLQIQVPDQAPAAEALLSRAGSRRGCSTSSSIRSPPRSRWSRRQG